VVADGHQIGLERCDLARLGLATAHQLQRIGGVTGIRIGSHWFVAFGLLHQRAGDDSSSADNGCFMIEPVLAAQASERGAKAVNDRKPTRRDQQFGQASEGALPCSS